MDAEEFIEHHGIKGQKWGVRHKPNPRTGLVSQDFKTSSALRKTPIHQLSTTELRIANDRANLEQNFRRLNPSQKEINRKKLKTVLAAVGVTSLGSFIKSKEGQKTMEVGQKWLIKGLQKASNAGKSQLIKRSARFAVKQRIKNL